MLGRGYDWSELPFGHNTFFLPSSPLHQPQPTCFALTSDPFPTCCTFSMLSGTCALSCSQNLGTLFLAFQGPCPLSVISPGLCWYQTNLPGAVYPQDWCFLSVKTKISLARNTTFLVFFLSQRSQATRFRWHQPAPFDKQQTWAIDNIYIGDGCIDMCSGHGKCTQDNCVWVSFIPCPAQHCSISLLLSC